MPRGRLERLAVAIARDLESHRHREQQRNATRSARVAMGAWPPTDPPGRRRHLKSLRRNTAIAPTSRIAM